MAARQGPRGARRNSALSPPAALLADKGPEFMVGSRHGSGVAYGGRRLAAARRPPASRTAAPRCGLRLPRAAAMSAALARHNPPPAHASPDSRVQGAALPAQVCGDVCVQAYAEGGSAAAPAAAAFKPPAGEPDNRCLQHSHAPPSRALPPAPRTTGAPAPTPTAGRTRRGATRAPTYQSPAPRARPRACARAAPAAPLPTLCQNTSSTPSATRRRCAPAAGERGVGTALYAALQLHGQR